MTDDDVEPDSDDERSRSERLFHGVLNVVEFVLDLF